MALIGRMFVVLFAFLVASLAAAIVLQLGVLLPFVGILGEEFPDANRVLVQVMVALGFVFVAWFALLPAVAVIALAEAFRLRSILFYAVAGGLGALALGYGSGQIERPFDASRAPLAEWLFAAGIAAGMVYWLIAGRNAGRWCEPAGPPR